MKLLVMISAVAGLAGSALAAGGSLGSGLVVLDTTASGALSMNGNASIQVPARAVYVNSNSPTAVSTVGNAVLDAPNLYIVGNAYFGGHSLCTGVVHPSGSPFGDPLSGISMPNAFGETPLAAVSFSSGLRLANRKIDYDFGRYLADYSGKGELDGSQFGQNWTPFGYFQDGAIGFKSCEIPAAAGANF